MLNRDFGLVIGTFAAVPYIHLQLEARRRLYPDVPLLIHDDGSAQAEPLQDLASAYGATLLWVTPRKRHHLGDLNVYPTALKWCRENGLPYLLKLSRRWIWRVDWREHLRSLFLVTEAPTVSNHTISYGFGFRTECVAFDVREWACREFFDDVQERLRAERHVFVENYIHIWAQKLALAGSARWQQWQLDHPSVPDRCGYAPWDLMGNCRHEPSPARLWHNSNAVEDYADLAHCWGLPHGVQDFVDPNAGEGVGEGCVETQA